MNRHRGPRPFVVEIKPRQRRNSVSPNARVLTSSAAGDLWSGTNLHQEIDRLKEMPPSSVSADPAGKPAQSKGNARRILPGLLPAQALSNVAEPHSPTALPDAAGPSANDMSVDRSRVEPEEQRAYATVEARRADAVIDARAEPIKDTSAPTSSASVALKKRKTELSFRAGERWKRRLPRACWSWRRSC